VRPEAPAVVEARIEAERTRARLMDTAHRLQARISPGALAANAWQGAKEKGADIAETAVDAVRKRPIAATGVVAAVTLFLAREPLIELAEKLSDSFKGEKNTTKKKSTEKVA
jgi:ElaB/YqjD/DUF883 family membrane-anchored ribosome-binding protein